MKLQSAAPLMLVRYLTACYSGWLRATAAALLLYPLFACGDSTAPEPPLPPVGAVVLEASNTELGVGDVVQVMATVLDTSGVVLQGRAVTWSSSDALVASVTASGLATAVGPGSATLTATSGGVSGQLTFTVQLGECRSAVTQPTTPGQTHDDSLSSFECVLLEGPFADGWQFTVTEQTGILFSMTSSDFDAFLLVTDPEVTVAVAFDDDSGEGHDAQFFHQFDPGTYIVWATSATRTGTGAYRLTSEIIEVASCDTPVGSIGPGDSTTGSLSFSSCLRNGAISDPWSLTVSEGERLGIELASSDFDTVLEITDGAGQTVAFDDDGGQGTNSLIVRDFVAGDYTVWVTSFGGGRTGNYSLSVAVTPVLPGVLFAQPPENVGINYGAAHYADDFTLSGGATIEEFWWWGSTGANTTTAIRLFADNGNGAPALEPFWEVLNPDVQSTATTIAPRGPGPVYLNQATLSNVPALQAGTRYYVSISGPDTWLSSTAFGVEWWSRAQETDPWSNASSTNPNNLSFRLIGLPESHSASQVLTMEKPAPGWMRVLGGLLP